MNLMLEDLYEVKAGINTEIIQLQHRIQELAGQRASINKLIAEAIEDGKSN